ncbi:hypothetical protein [Actomonas aquatica]|uniref:Type IV / VI secretion system DotU domain-containing protein n=1 Tax=Actomonas aquatica TaxID=2866162 RepID=A0ABZ1C5J4_9BACT|nr:hypothetical protein [Opitutus sp. WL0086]WRQ86761.1 hypothetical protein K1X11_018265 [Opitutus sp. WL0086]
MNATAPSAVATAAPPAPAPAAPTPAPVSVPPARSVDDWEEAFARVESYLRAHRLERRSRLTELTAVLVGRAQRCICPHETPVAAAMQVADHHINDWIERVVGSSASESDLARGRARLALEIADVPERWPDAFLDSGPIPEDLQQAMRAAYLSAGPELKFSNMAPRPIDLGPVANLAGQTWDKVRRAPRLRTLLYWSAIAAAAVLLWHLFRP